MAAVFVGAVLGWAGNYIMHRTRQSAERRDRLETAYAQWFTLQRIVVARFQAIYRLLEEFFESEAGYELAAAELEKVIPVWEGTLQAAHNIHLLETETSLVDSMYDWTETVERLYSSIFLQLSKIRANVRLTERLKALQTRMSDFPAASAEEAKELESKVAALKEELRGEYQSLAKTLRPGNEAIARLLERLTTDGRAQLRLLPQRLKAWPRKIS